MHARAYLSNISPSWPIEEQEKLLAARVPGWPIPTFTDRLKPRALRSREPEKLTERAGLLRPTGRPEAGEVHVATLAIMAWRQLDFRDVLVALGARRESLVAHEEGRTFDLTTPEGMAEAFAMFPVSRTDSGRRKGRLRGVEAAAAAKLADSKADADKIRHRWGVEGYTATGLCAEVGRSFQTMKRHLGLWEHAKRKRARNARRAAKAEIGVQP